MSRYITANFRSNEFYCKCPNCKKNNMDLKIVYKLQDVRTLTGTPMKINSAFRCADHNKAVGGSPTSSHRNSPCKAVDIACTDSGYRMKLLSHLINRFHRIGVRKDFIHVDDDLSKAQEVLWVY